MAGETTGTGGAASQAGAAAQPQAGTTAGGQAPQQPPSDGGAAGAGTEGGQQQPGTESETERIARLERELTEARREAASNRTKARTLEQQQAAAAQAGMTEAERAQAKQAELERANAELQQRLQEQAVRSATAEAAARLGYRSPDIAYRLLDRAELEYNDAGEPKNVEKLLRALLEREPYLAKAAGADFGGGNRGTTPGAGGQPGMNDLLKAALGRG